MNIDLLHGMRMRLRYYLKLLELKTRIAPRKEKEGVGYRLFFPTPFMV